MQAAYETTQLKMLFYFDLIFEEEELRRFCWKYDSGFDDLFGMQLALSFSLALVTFSGISS